MNCDDIRIWNVVFWHRSVFEKRFWKKGFYEAWWAWIGGYRHVSAFGYSPKFDLWVHYEPTMLGTRIELYRNDEDFDVWIAIALGNGVVFLDIEATDGPVMFFRGPLTCVSSIKHLLGIRCGAFTPRALFRTFSRLNYKRASYNGEKQDPSD